MTEIMGPTVAKERTAEHKWNAEVICKCKEDLGRANGILEGLEMAAQIVRKTLREPGILGTTDLTREGRVILALLGEKDKYYMEASQRLSDSIARIADEQGKL